MGETEPESPRRFPIVAICASAGAVVQHLALGHESMLADILARSAPIPTLVVVEDRPSKRAIP